MFEENTKIINIVSIVIFPQVVSHFCVMLNKGVGTSVIYFQTIIQIFMLQKFLASFTPCMSSLYGIFLCTSLSITITW